MLATELPEDLRLSEFERTLYLFRNERDIGLT